MKFDRSLSKAIDNEYVQEVNLVDWDDDNRLLLPYVIADEKNLVLFFQIPEDFEQEKNQWINISLKNMKDSGTGEKIEGYSYTTSGLSLEAREENYGFIMQNYHFTEGKLPKMIDIEVEVLIENFHTPEETVISTEPYNYTSNSSLDNIGTFNFHIELEDFVDPIIYEINENHTVFGQNIVVEDMKVYPTGTEVSFSFPIENSSLIKELELEVILGDNDIVKGKINGLSATYNNESMFVFIESNYFGKAKEQELLIKGGRILDKSEEYITVDLDNETINPNIEGIELKQVIRESDNVTLVFSTQVTDDDNFGVFNHDYKDTDGNIYSFDSEETTSYNSQMETRIKIKYQKNGKVILQRSLTPKILLEEPIRIKLLTGD